MSSLCHLSTFPFLVILHQNRFLMSFIKFSFFGNMASMCCLCHSSVFPFLEILIQNGFLMSSIGIFFFGKLGSKCVAYVIHQNFCFWNTGNKIYCLCHPSQFPFLAIPTQNGCPAPPIKISFFGNSHSKWVAYVIYQNFLFWKYNIKKCHLCHPSNFPFLVSHLTCLSNPPVLLISPFGLSSNW